MKVHTERMYSQIEQTVRKQDMALNDKVDNITLRVVPGLEEKFKDMNFRLDETYIMF